MGSALQREAAERDDGAGLLRMGDEVRRRDQSLGGMVPAQQGLEAGDAGIGEADDGLVVKVELAVVDGAAQVGLERDGVAGRELFQIARIDPGAGAAEALGLEQRQLGVLEQVERIAGAAAGGNADAGRREDVAAAERIRRSAGLQELAAERLRLAAAGAEQHREGVAADAENFSGALEALDQALRHLAEQRVAAAVAEAGMDGLEAVDVEQREGGGGEAGAELVQLLHQRDAVAQARQGIAQGAFQQLALALLARRDVGHQSEAARGGGAVAEHGGAQFEPGIAAGLAVDAELDAEGEAGMAAVIVEGGRIDVAILGMDARDPVVMMDARAAFGQADQGGGVARQLQEIGFEIEIEDALVRGGDGLQRGGGQRAGRRRRGAVVLQDRRHVGHDGDGLERQDRDALAGRDRERQQQGTGGGETAGGGGRPGLAAVVHGRERRGEGDEREDHGGGRGDARRLGAETAAIDQIGGDGGGADHDHGVDQDGGGGDAEIGEQREDADGIEREADGAQPAGRPDIVQRHDGVGQHGAGDQRQACEHRHQAVRAADRGGEAAVEQAGLGQPLEQDQGQRDRGPARRRMSERDREAGGEQRGGADHRPHRGGEDRELAVVGRERRLGPGEQRRRLGGVGDAHRDGDRGRGRHDDAEGLAAIGAHPGDGDQRIGTGDAEDRRASRARQDAEADALRLVGDEDAGGRADRRIGRGDQVPARAVGFRLAAGGVIGLQALDDLDDAIGAGEIDRVRRRRRSRDGRERGEHAGGESRGEGESFHRCFIVTARGRRHATFASSASMAKRTWSRHSPLICR